MLWGLDYLRGSVELQLRGNEPERCLNAFVKQRIAFWNITRPDEVTITCRIFLRDCAAALHEAQRCMCDIKQQNERSFCRTFYGLKRRWALLLGTVCVVCALIFLPKFIWTLRVVGCEQLHPEQILRALETLDVGFGTWAPGLDGYRIKNEMLNLVPELRWISVNTQGGVATVLVAERTQGKPVCNKHEGASNLIACTDGIISQISVLNGQAVCKVGDAVCEGQLLVSGLVDLERCSMATHAMGEVYARTRHDVVWITPNEVGRVRAKGHEGCCLYLTLGQKRIKLFGSSGISTAGCVKMINIKECLLPGGDTLPLRLTLVRHQKAEITPVRTDALSAQTLLQQTAEDAMLAHMVAGSIETMHRTLTQCDGCWRLEVLADCTEMIARSAELQIME